MAADGATASIALLRPLGQNIATPFMIDRNDDHNSQKNHCNDNCNDFSDYNDIIGQADNGFYHLVLRGAIILQFISL